MRVLRRHGHPQPAGERRSHGATCSKPRKAGFQRGRKKNKINCTHPSQKLTQSASWQVHICETSARSLADSFITRREQGTTSPPLTLGCRRPAARLWRRNIPVCVCRPLRGSRGEGRTGLGQPRAPEAAVPPPAAPCRAEGQGLRHGSRPAASRTPQPRAASPGPRSNG